jgi:hypothetical protein
MAKYSLQMQNSPSFLNMKHDSLTLCLRETFGWEETDVADIVWLLRNLYNVYNVKDLIETRTPKYNIIWSMTNLSDIEAKLFLETIRKTKESTYKKIKICKE